MPVFKLFTPFVKKNCLFDEIDGIPKKHNFYYKND